MAAAEQIDPAALDLPTLSALLTFAGLDPSGTPSLPDEAAGTQALIEALPTGLRDAMLAGYFSAIFQPNR